MGMTARHQWYLQKIGICTWVRREQICDSNTRVDNVDNHSDRIKSGEIEIRKVRHTGDSQQLSSDAWRALEQQVSGCTKCELHKDRNNTVFGVGNRHAQCMIIGEAPGADEDMQGEPFVGRAGKLLNNMLLSIGLQRNAVFIANILKCRPPNNRDPKPAEVESCKAFLHAQIELIQPKLLVAVGRIAAQQLLQTDISLSRLRGRVHQFELQNLPLVVTYHPAYLLRTPREKNKAWQDLKLIHSFLASDKVN